jgi:hypothetical protein
MADQALPMKPPSRSKTVFIALAVFILALSVRMVHLQQCLWFDEQTTLIDYVLAPWHKVLAATRGEYVPNNHVLSTVLCRLAYWPDAADPFPPNEALLRVPALLAGALLPLVMAWPFRRSAPGLSLAIALLASMHPWLVAFSDEARGYSLMMLLGILATLRLPQQPARWPVGYALLMTAALYTIPVALLLLAAHAIVMAVLRRPAWFSWLRGAGIALLLTILLYLPMSRGMIQYWKNPFPNSGNYSEFLDALPRFALAGERLPRHADPILPLPDAPGSSVFWALPVLLAIVGTGIAWANAPLRPMLLTLCVATLLGAVAPLLIPSAGQVRFVPWMGIWICISAAALLCAPIHPRLRFVSYGGMVLLLGWMVMRNIAMPPNEPIREAIALADRLAPPGSDIMIGFLGAREALALYGQESVHHDLLVGPDIQWWQICETVALANTRRRPWVVMPYEDLARRRNDGPEDSRGLWVHLMKNYRLVTRLPGRISPVAIYEPRPDPNSAGYTWLEK